MREFFLIRHGETDWNLEGRYQGQSDIPLNGTGLLQARRVAESLEREGLKAIFSSDLERARQTAALLSEETGAKVIEDPRLREIHQGDWEGKLFSEIRKDYSEILQRRRRDPLGTAPPGGETVSQVRERVLAAMADILKRHPAEKVAIVSHGLALALIKVHFRNLPIESVWDHIPDNAVPERIMVEAT